MSVVVEVANDGDVDPQLARPSTIAGTALAAASLFTVTRTSSDPAVGQSGNLLDRALHIGGIGVGHGLHHHRRG